MAFALGAANAPSLGDWLTPGLSPRVAVGQGPYPSIHARNTSDTQNNTVNLFLDSLNGKFEYGASIITACADQTVFAIQCTSGPQTIGPTTCGPNGAIATLTIGPSKYEFSSAITTKTMGHDVTGTVMESCVLASTTAATCDATIRATADGTSTATTTVETLAGASYHRFDVEITAGAEKTVNPAATCSAEGAAASRNPKTMAIWALAGVICVASILTI